MELNVPSVKIELLNYLKLHVKDWIGIDKYRNYLLSHLDFLYVKLICLCLTAIFFTE